MTAFIKFLSFSLQIFNDIALYKYFLFVWEILKREAIKVVLTYVIFLKNKMAYFSNNIK